VLASGAAEGHDAQEVGTVNRLGRSLTWDRLKSEPGEEYRMFRIRRDWVRSPRDGTEHRFDIIEAADAVSVIALTEEDEVVLVEQFRLARREVTLELPGGIIEDSQGAEEAALRELREETGYTAGRTEHLGIITLNPSRETTRVHVVRALGCRLAGEKELDPGEDTQVRHIREDQLREAITTGRIGSAVAVSAIALHLLGRGGMP
jgi:ADP-ribose pyrophosphatase